MRPKPAGAVVIDPMDAVVGYTAETDKSAVDNVALLVPGENNQAVQLNYNFATTDSYSQLVKNFSQYDMGFSSNADVGVRFHVRGSGSSNTLRFRLTDADGDQVSKTFTGLTDNREWQSVLIPVASFSTPAGGDGIFDFFRVTKMELALEKTGGGSGTLDVDRIELVQIRPSTGASILLEDFERGSAGVNNYMGGPIGTFTQDTAATISTTFDTTAGNVAQGATSLKITYNDGTRTDVDNAGYFNGPNSTNLNDASQIEFYAKASNEDEAFRLNFGYKLNGTTGTQTINVGGVGKSWQKIVIPFRNFDRVASSGTYNKTPGFASLTEFVFIFSPTLSAGAGDLWLDDLRFTKPALSSGTVLKVIDDLEETTSPSLTSWEAAPDAGATAVFSSIEDGVSGRALRMTYELKSGAYAVMVRNMVLNATVHDSFRFRYKLSGKSNGVNVNNTLEFNVLDTAGSRHKYTLPDFAPTDGNWRTLTAPLSEFTKVSGTLDLKKLKDIRFTVLKSGGGKGLFAIDDFELVNAPKTVRGEPDRIIRSLSTDNNPFSPNGDGVRDTVSFAYDLKESAYVRLRVYNPQGGVVKEFKPLDAVAAGAQSFLWNGYDDDNNRLANGLYFFQLKADSTLTGGQDRETGVLAILR